MEAPFLSSVKRGHCWRKACLVSAFVLASLFVLQLVAPSDFFRANNYTSRRRFVTGTFCHPFALPKGALLSLISRSEQRLTDMGPGYCLCADDEKKTVIAGLKSCGSKPVMCEKACTEHTIVGEKTPPCVQKTHSGCREWSSHENMQTPSDDMIQLAREFHLAMGPHLGVQLPHGSRRDLFKDFVLYGRQMSKADVGKVRQRIEKFKRQAPTFPKRTFHGRGIVVVGGSSPKFSTSFWIVVHALRRTGSKLPIQIWFPDGELPDCSRVSELKRLNVTVSSFPDLNRAGNGFVEVTNRFMFKIVALFFSPFDEVLLLDSDNIILRDPEELFSSASYLSTGSLLWMDFWGRSSAPDCQLILGNSTAVFHTHESGQVMIKKSDNWEALALALFMNAHSYFFYPLTINYMGLGDKEIIAMAFLHLGMPYGLIRHGPDHVGVRDHDRSAVLGNTMLQHSPGGVPFFLHANLGKPSVWVPNSPKTYVRRWQTSMLHGDAFPKILNVAAKADDFELWYFSVIRDRRCIFDDRPARHWYHTLGFGPPVEGFHVSDHYNINKETMALKASR